MDNMKIAKLILAIIIILVMESMSLFILINVDRNKASGSSQVVHQVKIISGK